MCILFIAIEQHPDFPLIITANRDEYHGRASQSLHQWQDHDGIVAGRDLQAGGTWLGVNQAGEFAAITNFRTAKAPNPAAVSRGELVVKALSSKSSDPATEKRRFDQELDLNHHRYNPFNLVYGDIKGLQAWDYQAGARRPLSKGFHSVSNGPIDDLWPKMANGVSEVGALISRQSDLDPSMLMKMMRDETQAPENQLPNTGIAPEQEQLLSSIFIKGENYGTRTTTVLLFERNKLNMIETNFNADAESTETTHKTIAY